MCIRDSLRRVPRHSRGLPLSQQVDPNCFRSLSPPRAKARAAPGLPLQDRGWRTWKHCAMTPNGRESVEGVPHSPRVSLCIFSHPQIRPLPQRDYHIPMECDSRVEGEAGSVDGRIYTAILSGSEALLPLIRDHWESLRSASKFSSLGLGAASRVQFVLSRGEVRVTGSSWDPLAEIAEGHVNAVGLFSGDALVGVA